jgi:ubiquinol-cytochrome c reductase iron-sulfur subunit
MSKHESIVAIGLLAAIAGAAAFVTAYALGWGIRWEGLTLALCFASLALVACGWAFWILPVDRSIDVLDVAPSSVPERRAAVAELQQGEREISRPKALAALLAAAIGSMTIALIVPFRSMGPGPQPSNTKWRRGSRLVREDGREVRTADLNVDSEVTVFPHGAVGDAMSQVALIRLPQNVGNGVDGYIAYSRVCTHAGCPVALYRADRRQLFCPCHQSVFDAVNGGKVLAGPADRPLPQLPIAIDNAGYLIADGDFPGPVGPSAW